MCLCVHTPNILTQQGVKSLSKDTCQMEMSDQALAESVAGGQGFLALVLPQG